jgi:hypothetical protein
MAACRQVSMRLGAYDINPPVMVPKRHDLHVWQKSYAIDVESGLRGIAKPCGMLRRSGRSLVDDVLRNLDYARPLDLSTGGSPAEHRQQPPIDVPMQRFQDFTINL